MGELKCMGTGLILDLRPANERWCYFVTTSLVGWAQARISPVGMIHLNLGSALVGLFLVKKNMSKFE